MQFCSWQTAQALGANSANSCQSWGAVWASWLHTNTGISDLQEISKRSPRLLTFLHNLTDLTTTFGYLLPTTKLESQSDPGRMLRCGMLGDFRGMEDECTAHDLRWLMIRQRSRPLGRWTSGADTQCFDHASIVGCQISTHVLNWFIFAFMPNPLAQAMWRRQARVSGLGRMRKRAAVGVEAGRENWERQRGMG